MNDSNIRSFGTIEEKDSVKCDAIRSSWTIGVLDIGVLGSIEGNVGLKQAILGIRLFWTIEAELTLGFRIDSGLSNLMPSGCEIS